MDYTTKVSVKSLLIEFVQKLMEINGCLELQEKYVQKYKTVKHAVKNGQQNCIVYSIDNL